VASGAEACCTCRVRAWRLLDRLAVRPADHNFLKRWVTLDTDILRALVACALTLGMLIGPAAAMGHWLAHDGHGLVRFVTVVSQAAGSLYCSHGLVRSCARAVRKSRSATLPANVAVCSVLNPLSRIRAGSGSLSR
jgi:hypothetical protein